MIFFSCNKVIIILFLDLYTLYCNIRNSWNIFVINLSFVNTWCSFLNCIHWTSSRRKNCFNFSLIFRLLKRFQNAFFSRINWYCFFIFNKTLRIRWDDVLSTICLFFILYFFLFRSQCLLKLKQTKRSSQLNLLSSLLCDT